MDLVLTFATALFLSIAFIPMMIRYASRWHLVDVPVDERKIHAEPIPRVGGIGIAVSAFIAVSYWLVPFGALWDELCGLFVGGGVIVIFGLLDDRFDLSYKLKFLGQILAVLPLLYSGIYFDVVPFLGLSSAPQWIGLPLTLLFMLGAINAVNLADGLDGLAAGITVLSLAAVEFLALQSNQHGVALVTIGVAGGLLGFLRYNTHPAKVFMGDAGSQFLGFITAALAIKVTQFDAIAISPILPLLLVGIPVMDTFLVMGIRLWQKNPIFKADKNHTHHQFMALGFRHYEAVAAIYVLQAALLGGAWALRYESDGCLVGFYLLFCGSVIGAIGVGRIKCWHLHPVHVLAGENRRNQLLRRFGWFYSRSSRVVEVFLAVFFVGVAGWVETPTPGLANIAISVAAISGILWALQGYIGLSQKAVTRILFYSAGAVLVFALLIDKDYRPVFNIAIDVYLAITTAVLFLAIRMTRREVFRFDTQDLLIVLLVLIMPLLPLNEFSSVALGRFALRFAVILYCCEYLVGYHFRDYKLLNMAAIVSMTLLALVD